MRSLALNVLRKCFYGAADPLLRRIANRLEYLKLVDHDQRCLVNASFGPDTKIYSEARIDNFTARRDAIKIGAGTHIRGQLLTFWDGGEINIGSNCYVGEASRIWSQCSVVIGNNVMISHAVDIHDTDSHPLNHIDRRDDTYSLLTKGVYLTPTKTRSRPVIIHDDAWLGFKSSILKGVTVGKGAVVAAGSVVTKDVPPFTIVGGIPAKPIAKCE